MFSLSFSKRISWTKQRPHSSKSLFTNRHVSIALGYGLDDRSSRVRFPAGAGDFSLHYRVQNGSGAHPASYSMGTGGSFPGSKAAGCEADHSPQSSAEVKVYMELYFHSPNTPSWLCAQLKHRDFTFTMFPVNSTVYSFHNMCSFCRPRLCREFIKYV
jgi:hypothetical protein